MTALTRSLTRGAVAAAAVAALGWALLSTGATPATATVLSADDRELGRQLAGHAAAQALPTPDATAEGRALAAALRWRGVRTVSVLADSGSVSQAQLAALSQQLTVVKTGGDARVLLTDAGSARAEVARIAVARTAPTYGIWIAPELFDRDVLDAIGTDGTAAPPVVTVLPVDPLGATAVGYLGALARTAPDRAPSYAGLLGWIDAHPALATPARWRIYVSGAATALPPSLDHDHGQSIDWLTIGGVNAASPVLEDA